MENLKYTGQRLELVKILIDKGIKNVNVLNAFSVVPRHLFVDSTMIDRAYEDIALPIQDQQTISQPFTVAYQTELLNLTEGSRVLEIGTGSGFQAAILCQMNMNVFTVERHNTLLTNAKKLLISLGYRFQSKLGDGSLGWSTYAPFDAIVVTAASPGLPQGLINQLNIGGRLVIPIGDLKNQKMNLITKTSETEFERLILEDFKFVPLIGSEGWKE